MSTGGAPQSEAARESETRNSEEERLRQIETLRLEEERLRQMEARRLEEERLQETEDRRRAAIEERLEASAVERDGDVEYDAIPREQNGDSDDENDYVLEDNGGPGAEANYPLEYPGDRVGNIGSSRNYDLGASEAERRLAEPEAASLGGVSAASMPTIANDDQPSLVLVPAEDGYVLQDVALAPEPEPEPEPPPQPAGAARASAEDGPRAPGSASEATSATEASSAVYNLDIEPLESRAPLALIPDVDTRLVFYIGPQSDTNTLPASAEINPDVFTLADQEQLEINVTLNCLVCNSNSYQRRSFIYDPNIGRSIENVEFVIQADASLVDSTTGVGTLLLTVDARGIDLDVINVPVFVGAPTPAQLTHWTPPAIRPIKHDLVLAQSPPDLVIDIANAPRALIVTLIPHRIELKEALDAKFENPPLKFWTFEAGVTKADLDDLVRDAYFEQRAMINQNETSLQDVYARFDRDVDLSDGAARLVINDADRKSMLKLMRSHGARIYKRMFLRGDRNLGKAMRFLEDFELSDGYPLRVQIRASNVYAPWQLLYTGRARIVSVKPELFWGFRYEMGTRQLVDAAQASLQTIMDPPTAEQIMFAAYHSPNDSDEVAQRARLFADHVAEKIAEPLDLVDSRDEFLDRLIDDGPSMRLIIAYGHASNGTNISTAPAGGATAGDEIAGTWFRFSVDNYMQPRDIDDAAPPPDEGLLLDAQPIVIFNACETGAGGNRAMNNNGFVGALTRAGARAIIVTETPVWNNFAYHFGTEVLDGLLSGKQVQTALLDARLHHLEEWNNPLGLVYSLYGNPAARFVTD